MRGSNEFSKRESAADHGAAPIDLKWYFEDYLPEAIARSPVALIEEMTATVGFVIVGRRGGAWYCRFEGGRLTRVDSRSRAEAEVDFGFRVDYDGFVEIVGGRRPIQDVFFGGGIDVSGDVRRALMMVPIMGSFFRDFPAPQGSGGGRSVNRIAP